jgi:ribonuclease HI
VLPETVADDDCVIRYGIPLQNVEAFFNSADGILQRDPAGHDFPSTTQAALRMSVSVNLEDFDRIIIYSDGSSHALDKHKPALWFHKGRPDTWAFTVLGERYHGPEGHSIEVLGWLAHEVHYEADSPHHLGADSIGSDIAEREALTWACLWRLAHNVATPILFRTDSQISALQATGCIGCSDIGISFQCFRGVFQALETALPGDALQVEHIPGHTQEPFNDMVDWLAKKEREKSFYCQRQKISMAVWRRLLPHLWTFFSYNDGLPPRCTEGLHAYAPSLPPDLKLVQKDDTVSRKARPVPLSLTLSFCTANIASRYNGSWGHAG